MIFYVPAVWYDDLLKFLDDDQETPRGLIYQFQMRLLHKTKDTEIKQTFGKQPMLLFILPPSAGVEEVVYVLISNIFNDSWIISRISLM